MIDILNLAKILETVMIMRCGPNNVVVRKSKEKRKKGRERVSRTHLAFGKIRDKERGK